MSDARLSSRPGRLLQRLVRRLVVVALVVGAALMWLPCAAQDGEAVAESQPAAERGVDQDGVVGRLLAGQGDGLDVFIAACMAGLLVALVVILWCYVRGLRGSPRELYLLFFTKVTEYSAYGAANMAFVLYLNKDHGLSDLEAGSFIGAWSIGMTLLTVLVGAVCDAIGVKKTLLIGCYALLLSRITMPFIDSLLLVVVLGFVPLAFGIAITGPVLSVGIKQYTTREGAAMGFALFYTLLNVGWAIGGWIFDTVREIFGDGKVHAMPVVGGEISTYQIIILVGFFLTIPDLIAISLMREGVEMGEDGMRVVEQPPAKRQGGPVASIIALMKQAARDTGMKMASVFRERAFWVFILLIGILAFVRLTFYHMHYTFPSYGIRLFGEGAKVGTIWGVLNPVLIVFLVPLFGVVTKRVKSYWMMLAGTCLSVASVFLALLPEAWFVPLVDTVLGDLVYDRWLGVPEDQRLPFYLPLILFFVVFTIGEAIWSPRLTQFMAEVAPKGKEGSYIALSYLPFFGAKFIAGPMSGWLLATYVPEGAEQYPQHYMVWVWIGLMAALTPAGMAICYRLYKRADEQAEAERG